METSQHNFPTVKHLEGQGLSKTEAVIAVLVLPYDFPIQTIYNTSSMGTTFVTSELTPNFGGGRVILLEMLRKYNDPIWTPVIESFLRGVEYLSKPNHYRKTLRYEQALDFNIDKYPRLLEKLKETEIKRQFQNK